MSMCEAVSDRMPAVASGRSEWTAEERAHLASLQRLRGGVEAGGRRRRRWGGDVTVDAAALTPLVLERVRAAKVERRGSRWVRRVGGGGWSRDRGDAAADAGAGAEQRCRQVPPAGVMAEPAELQLAELDDAAPAELEMVLVEFDEPAVPASSLDGPDLEGLDMSQVERALRSWEES